MRICGTLLFLLLAVPAESFGQLAAASSASENRVAHAVSVYKDATSQSQNLYNGRQYYLYDARQEEHQFFEQRKWRSGVILFDGQRFDSVPMLYDINRDQMVIRHFNGDHMLLQSEKIDFFKIDNHHFEMQLAGKDIDEQMKSGFYEVLYNGTTRTLIRRTKQRQEKIAEKLVIALYPQKNFFYIRRNGSYHFVNTKRSVLNLFPDRKKELRSVLKSRHIKFRKNREIAIATIVAAYDESAKL